MINKIKSDFLVASPSFASGAGRLLDWYGLYDSYNVSRSGQEADAKAMFADWRMVGEDLNNALVEFEVEQPVK
ncbi:MAG: hypothetical protein ABSE28_03180 [Candidatus Sulfotelmatobacter sp.]|jgi:hypothetical protein